MSDVIKLLPDSVANQIAAGEVIQRPASVIKELVENAVDAGATAIQIVIKDAGRTLIQVIDNGSGMSDTDARLAFERHSTSKIRQAADLFTLHTMGFRGEALASIAAIAQVELRTRTADSQLGTCLIINASTCESQTPVACPQGSNFMVKNIFFNVPARRKFLKSNQVELSNIIREFEKLALVNYHLDFTLTHNGTLMYKLGAGTFLQRISALMGKAVADQLLPVSAETSLVRISGYVSRPEAARKRSFRQFLFANERYMRHPYFHRAILSCYDRLIPADHQPGYFVRFDVDPGTIDVNIHPTKTEIKFENEQEIWQILAASVRQALGQFSEAPPIDFDTSGMPDIPPYGSTPPQSVPTIDVDPSYNPFSGSNRSSNGGYRRNISTVDWEQLYRNFERTRTTDDEPTNDDDIIPADATVGKLPLTEPSGQSEQATGIAKPTYVQVKNRYIICSVKSGLMVVDQHRAHTRVLYDRYVEQLSAGTVASQTLLFPEQLHLTAPQDIILQSALPEIQRAGFSIASLGDGDWCINAVPAGLGSARMADVLTTVMDMLDSGNVEQKAEQRVLYYIALQMATSAALPAGRPLSQTEMETLVADLLRLAEPNYTPDGKVVLTVIPTEYVDSLF